MYFAIHRVDSQMTWLFCKQYFQINVVLFMLFCSVVLPGVLFNK